MKYLDHARLKETMSSTLHGRGVENEAVRHVAESLVTTSLRGVDSHGVNLFPHYVRAVEAGRIKARPEIQVEFSGRSVAKLDADHAFGHYAGSVAMEQAVRLARETGVGAVSVFNSTHFGAAAYFALQATGHDCIGCAFTNADALVKVHNAKEAFFGTNPICFAAPLVREEPFCLDMATSMVSWNKVLNFRTRGERLPPDWAFDHEGRAVSDPASAVSLNPAGAYKGFGLGMMVDILCALLSASPVSKDLLPMYSSPIGDRRRISHFFLALSIRHFTDPSTFRIAMQDLVDRIRSMQPLAPDVPVMVAGDPEKLTHGRRLESGIPMELSKYEEFVAVNAAFADTVCR